MKKVKGKEGLLKDPHTGCVVNTDLDGLQQARATKRRILEEREKNKRLEDRVNRLESALEVLLEKEKLNG